MMEFRQKSLEQRCAESTKILSKYRWRIPIIMGTDSTMILDKYKYLVQDNLTIAQFVFVLRKRMNIDSTKAIFIFVNNTIPPSSASIRTVYDSYSDIDGFLYFSIRGENTFGNF